jgi:uncharacterized protein (DUF934 family)
MDRLERGDRAPGGGSPAETLSLAEWLCAGRPPTPAVRLAPEDDIDAHLPALLAQARLVIEFPSFMDGRGFSHACRLRSLGYRGRLIASGDLLADQRDMLMRCGFDDVPSLVGGRPAFSGFSASYQ